MTEAVAQKTQAPIVAKQTVSRRYVHTYHMGICIFIKFSVIDVRKKAFEAKGEVLLTNIQFIWLNHCSTFSIKKQCFPSKVYNFIYVKRKNAYRRDPIVCAFLHEMCCAFEITASPS